MLAPHIPRNIAWLTSNRRGPGIDKLQHTRHAVGSSEAFAPTPKRDFIDVCAPKSRALSPGSHEIVADQAPIDRLQNTRHMAGCSEIIELTPRKYLIACCARNTARCLSPGSHEIAVGQSPTCFNVHSLRLGPPNQ